MYAIHQRAVWVLTLLVVFSKTQAQQVFENDAGYREKHFIYEVKLIDEFFERFNDDSSSFIRSVYKTRHIPFTLTRDKLIRSLFNYQAQHWDTTMIHDFIATVTVPGSPVLLNFYGDNWYAEVNCQFQYKAGTVEIPLILKIEAENSGARWVIVAVKSNPMKQVTTEVRLTGSPEHRSRSMNPVVHGNNFIELDSVFRDRGHLSEYFDSLFFNRKFSLNFYDAIQKNQIQFIKVTHVRYHYLQAAPWIFTVDYFERKDLNAGWLINTLEKVSPPDMEAYRKRLLEE